MTTDDYWELETGDQILVDTADGPQLSEFVEHLYSGGFLFKRFDARIAEFGAREDLLMRVNYK